MTVAPIYSRPLSLPAARRARPVSVTRPAAEPPIRLDAESSDWTLTVELRVAGNVDPDALDLIRGLQRLVTRNNRPQQVSGFDPRLVRLDPAARSVMQGTKTVPLSRLEFDLLLFLAEHPERAHSREELLRRVWRDEESGTRTVDVHVRRLRAKTGEVSLITTVRNVGYRLADDARVLIVR
jgi:hypothetical protein